jgi:cytochrome P450
VSVDFDPYSHRWKRDPYAKYRELRDRSPIHYSPDSDCFTISRHADVQAVLKAPEIFSSKDMRRQRVMLATTGPLERLRLGARFLFGMRAAPWQMMRSRMLIREDGSTHELMRNIVNRGFTPRRIASLEARVRELAQEGLTRLRARDSFDLMEELAIPLPVTVIAELLGVDADHQHAFKRWSDAIIQGGTGSAMGEMGGVPFEAMKELRHYLRPIVRARRKQPADDLISTLVTAEGAAALSDFEVYLFVLLLLVAGNETTTNLLGNGVDALLEHPDQLERVCADPTLVPGLVEETLRFDGPVQFVVRETRVAHEFGGTQLPARAHVVLLLGSANRDERHFPEPDRFDVTRDTSGHLGLGFGAHFCLGASLARLEAKAAFEVLVPELPHLTRVCAEPEFLDSYQIRGRAGLELRAA